MNKGNKQVPQKSRILTDAKSQIDPQTEKGKRILTDANSKSDEQIKPKQSGKTGTPNHK